MHCNEGEGHSSVWMPHPRQRHSIQSHLGLRGSSPRGHMKIARRYFLSWQRESSHLWIRLVAVASVACDSGFCDFRRDEGMRVDANCWAADRCRDRFGRGIDRVHEDVGVRDEMARKGISRHCLPDWDS